MPPKVGTKIRPERGKNEKGKCGHQGNFEWGVATPHTSCTKQYVSK